MEIWNALTLQPLYTFQSSGAAIRFRCGVTYSPDGHSIASCSDNAIVIWDTQTGGEVTKVECKIPSNGLKLIWSLGGEMIGAISLQESGTLTVYTYNISMGKVLLLGTLQSRYEPHIWAHKEAFHVMTTTAWDGKGCKINIFEAGTTLTKVESFPLKFFPNLRAFSPTTYQVSTEWGIDDDNPELIVLDIYNSEILLQEKGSYHYPSFSKDGSFFAAFAEAYLFIWKYISGHYIQWRKFQQPSYPIQFSPDSSLILVCHQSSPLVLHRDFFPTTSSAKPAAIKHRKPKDAYSPNGNYIATTHEGDSTIKITSLHSQNPSFQFIDTGLEIKEIILTGDVLLVKGPTTLMAWLLTKEGAVSGVPDNRRADDNDSLWSIGSQTLTPQNSSSQGGNSGFWPRLFNREQIEESSDRYLQFSVEGGVGFIYSRTIPAKLCYNLGTGEFLKPNEVQFQISGLKWYYFYNTHRDDCDLYHRDMAKQHEPLEGSWPVSQTTLQDGWVKDPQGKHRLWLHARWRKAGNVIDWFDKVTVLRLKNLSELAVIKF